MKVSLGTIQDWGILKCQRWLSMCEFWLARSVDNLVQLQFSINVNTLRRRYKFKLFLRVSYIWSVWCSIFITLGVPALEWDTKFWLEGNILEWKVAVKGLILKYYSFESQSLLNNYISLTGKVREETCSLYIHLQNLILLYSLQTVLNQVLIFTGPQQMVKRRRV